MRPAVVNRLASYGRLMRLHQPIGVWLLLWPALWGLWLSSAGRPDQRTFVVFVVGTVLTRSAGCAMNDYADRHFDGHVARTKSRPIVAGEVRPLESVALCLVLCAIAFALVFALNPQTRLLAVAGGFLLATYPFVKRFFRAPQIYLGVAFNWSIPMAYAAHSGNIPAVAWLAFAAGALWTVAYDTMYATADRSDDRRIGVNSTAVLLGRAVRPFIVAAQTVSLILLALLGHLLHMGEWYAAGIMVATLSAAYQYRLMREEEPGRCLQAFRSNNYFGMAVFAGIALDGIFSS